MPVRLRNLLIVISGLIILSLIVVSLIGRDSVTIIEDKIGEILMPVSKMFAGIGRFIEDSTEPFTNVMNYRTLNDNLKRENQALKEEILSLRLDRKEILELKELQKALNFRPLKRNLIFVSASVIVKDPGNWFNYFTIDVGRKDGVTKNSAVISGSGLVGLVYEVGENWSKVTTIIDQRASVSFELSTIINDFDGILSGTKNFELIAEFFDPKATFKVGDQLITSGLGIYPRGILIGDIYSIEKDENRLLRRAKVKPAVNFRQINKVIVIPYKENN